MRIDVPGLKGAVPKGSRVDAEAEVVMLLLVSASRSGFDITRSSRLFMHVIPIDTHRTRDHSVNTKEVL